jgi:hypothetical protein
MSDVERVRRATRWRLSVLLVAGAVALTPTAHADSKVSEHAKTFRVNGKSVHFPGTWYLCKESAECASLNLQDLFGASSSRPTPGSDGGVDAGLPKPK